MTSSDPQPDYGQSTAWKPDRPSVKLFPLIVSWLATGVALMVAAWVLPGVDIESFWGALVVAAVVAALNAVIPPVLAALRLPLTLVLGFLLVLIADAVILQVAAELSVTDGVLQRRQLRLGAPRRVHRRRRQRRSRRPPRLRQHVLDPHRRSASPSARGSSPAPTSPGSSTSRSTGSHCRCCAGRCATGTRRTWPAGRVRRIRLAEWETDLSSQTGASQAGILLGSNEDISAFRWVEKETATMMTCSAPPDCAEIERRRGDRHRPARRRRRQPRQPSLRRGRRRDPHRQPDGRGEEVEPRLPGVLRERRQRDTHARPLRLGGHPRVDRRRSARSAATCSRAATAAASTR